MYVWNSRACDVTRQTLARGAITETSLFVVMKNRLPKYALMHLYATVRTVVIVDWRAVAGSPTENQHLDKGVTTDSMTRVIAFFETNKGCQVGVRNVRVFQPAIDLFKRRRLVLRGQRVNQLGEGQGVGSRTLLVSCGVDLSSQDGGPFELFLRA